jgi:hypothetical protein
MVDDKGMEVTFSNFEELAQRINEMTPEQRKKPVCIFDGNAGELNEVNELSLATDICEPAPEDQWVFYFD